MGPADVAPDDLDDPFWEACRDHVFLVHRCTACGRAYWPCSTCVDHGSGSMEWQPASGRAEVFTYTVVHHPYDASLADRLPYVAAVVRLDEGPFFHTDIVGCDPAEVYVGMRVQVVFDRLEPRPGEPDPAVVIPRFEPEEDPP